MLDRLDNVKVNLEGHLKVNEMQVHQEVVEKTRRINLLTQLCNDVLLRLLLGTPVQEELNTGNTFHQLVIGLRTNTAQLCKALG